MHANVRLDLVSALPWVIGVLWQYRVEESGLWGLKDLGSNPCHLLVDIEHIT